MGFTKVVVTRAGRLREWLQEELRLYKLIIWFIVLQANSCIFTFLCQILLLRSLVLDHTHLEPHVIVSVVNLKLNFHEQVFYE